MKIAPHHRRAGLALLFTLAALVLVTVAVIAFFSKAHLNRQVSFSSTHGVKSDFLARSAVDLIVGGLREQIRNGSTSAVATDGTVIYRPTSPAGMLPVFPLAGALGGSDVPVSRPSANGRALGRWFDTGPGLDTLTEPTWIYITRGEGATATPNLSAAPGSDAAVIGRFAFSAYPIGGLLDANAVGAPQALTGDADFIGNRGSLANLNLALLAGMSGPAAEALIQWRNPVRAASAETFREYVETGTGGFMSALADERYFLNRRDLLRYGRAHGVGDDALRLLSAFSRSANLPTYSPPTTSPLDPDPALIAVAGELLPRFPLQRLELLARNPSELSASDLANIERWFGLTPDSGNTATWKRWYYDKGGIATLAEVAAQNREPDFFELLQAGLKDGSLGTSGGQTLASTQGIDTFSTHQVIRIGANLIDQFDEDHFPTTIVFDGFEFYGVEDLPYINAVLLKPYWPNLNAPGGEYRQPPVKPFIAFEMWNPHQPTPADSGARPVRFRVRVNDEALYRVTYRGRATGATSGSSQVNPFGPDYRPLARVGGDPIEFDVDGTAPDPQRSYREPRLIREPGSATFREDIGANAIALPEITTPIPDQWIEERWNVWVPIEFRNTVFVAEYFDGTEWRPYSTFAGHDGAGGVSGISTSVFTAAKDTPDPDADAFLKADPRTFRFGTSFAFTRASDLPNSGSYYDRSLHPSANIEKPVYQAKPTFITNAPNDQASFLSRLAANTDAGHRYPDRDGVVRPGDAFRGGNPYATDEMAARPVILNRPFRSVGEIGYVYRDMPWKTLDLFSAESADAGLLDLFCLDEPSVSGGMVDLNTAPEPVLRFLLDGTAQLNLAPATALGSPGGIVSQIVSERSTPFLSRGELVDRLVGASAFPASGDESDIKTRREAAGRALGTVGSTRTWNLLIDVVAQSGRFAPGVSSPDESLVEGERRYWYSVAIDRLTGKVIAQKFEPIHD